MMWKYVGKGAYIPGVPTRDLTEEKAKAYGGVVEASPLYEKVEPARKSRKVQSEKTDEE